MDLAGGLCVVNIGLVLRLVIAWAGVLECFPGCFDSVWGII